MKKTKFFVIAVICLCLLLCCTGCAALLEKLEDAELRGYTEEMLAEILEGNAESAYELVDDVCTYEDFRQAFALLSQKLSGVESYELQLLSINTNTNFSGGESATMVSASYLLSSETGKYVVDVVRHSDFEELAGFHVTDYKSTALYYTGTLDSMSEAGVLQWLVLILPNLAALAVIILALVDCCRKKVKKKALVILLIVVVAATLSLQIGGGLSLNFSFGWLMSYSALVRYGSGEMQLRLLLPLGAIIYYCIRSRILIKEVPAPEAIAAEESESAEQVEAAEETPENEE